MSSWARRLAAGVVAGLLAHGAVAAEKSRMGLGRAALPEEVAAWDTDVRPDGRGLPPGRGDVWSDTTSSSDRTFDSGCCGSTDWTMRRSAGTSAIGSPEVRTTRSFGV